MKSQHESEAEQIDTLLHELSSMPSYSFPPPRKRLNAPIERGVYIIETTDGHVLHVGSTPTGKLGLRQRLNNHLAGKSSFVREFLGGDKGQLRSGVHFKYLVVENARQRALLEALAIGRFCPAHLGHGRD